MAVGIRAIGHAGSVASQGVDAGDDRRGHAGATEDQPTARSLVGIAVVHGDARIGVGYGRDVGYRTLATSGCDVRHR